MKRVIPGLLALAASAISAAGSYCAVTFLICMGWGGPDSHPIAIPVSIVGGLGCFCLFCLVAYFYTRLCSKQKRRWLILTDLAIFLSSLLPFFHLWSMVARYLAAL